MDFSIWNNAIDAEKFEKELEELKKNGNGNYSEIEPGNYVVKVDKMELKASRGGDPMVSIQFRILEGEHKKACIFYNQVVTKPFQIHLANNFLSSLGTGIDVKFDGNYENYSNLILDVGEACDKLEFDLLYGKNAKGYNTYRINEVYEG